MRAWRNVHGLDDRGFVRAWLFKIATNRCLTALERRGRRELPVDVSPDTPATEISWLEAYPDTTPEGRYIERESIELAYVAALQHLSPIQRATLILREVLGFSAAEVADLLDTSAASVNSALQRARKAVDSTAETQQDGLARHGGRFDHSARGAVGGRLGGGRRRHDRVDARRRRTLLDAAVAQWYRGHDAIRTFLVDGPLQSQWRFVPTTANGQLAFGTYMWDDAAGAFVPGGLDVLTLRDGRVAEVTVFLEADLTLFGLPAQLTA